MMSIRPTLLKSEPVSLVHLSIAVKWAYSQEVNIGNCISLAEEKLLNKV